MPFMRIGKPYGGGCHRIKDGGSRSPVHAGVYTQRSEEVGPMKAPDLRQIVTLLVAGALALSPATHDLNHDGVVNAVDIQIVIDAALGMNCSGR